MGANSQIRRVAHIAKAIARSAEVLSPASREVVAKHIGAAQAETELVISPSAVFVSWAHSGEQWSVSQAQAWSREVIEFTTVLRKNGMDADIDLYHLHETGVDWTRFGQDKVVSSDFVVIAMSEAWSQRWSGRNDPTLGAGAVGEADTLKGLFQQNQQEWQRKVVIALLPGQDPALIPPDLARLNRYSVDVDDSSTFDPLLRALTAQPLYAKPALGSVPLLPATISRDLQSGKTDGTTSEYDEYSALKAEVATLLKSQRLGNLTTEQEGRLSALQGILEALSS